MAKIWEVAAAFLFLSDSDDLHYTKLTKLVIESDLSGLGKHGGKTPAQTLKTELQRAEYNGQKVFRNSGYRGYYSLFDRETAKKIQGVQDVISVINKKNKEEDFIKKLEIATNDILQFNEEHIDIKELNFTDDEGSKKERYGSYYERKSHLRAEAIQIHGLKCKACGFDFKKMYGIIGEEYIEVHHLKPLCQNEGSVNPSDDMTVLCANCHRMVHRRRDSVLSIEQLIKIISDQKKSL